MKKAKVALILVVALIAFISIQNVKSMVSGSAISNVTVRDNIPAVITILTPQNTQYCSATLTFHVFLNEIGSVNFTIDQGATNYTMTTADSINFFYTFNNLTENSSYNFTAYALDSSNNPSNATVLFTMCGSFTTATSLDGHIATITPTLPAFLLGFSQVFDWLIYKISPGNYAVGFIIVWGSLLFLLLLLFYKKIKRSINKINIRRF